MFSQAKLGQLLSMLGLGGAAVVFGLYFCWVSWSVPDTPQPISCAEVIASGPGSNPFVELTGADFDEDQIILFGGDGESNWSSMYVPVHPPGESGDVIKLVLSTNTVKNFEQLQMFRAQAAYRGILRKGSGEWGFVSHMQAEFPDQNFSDCWVLTVNEDPQTGRILGLILLALGIAVVAVVFLFPKLWTASQDDMELAWQSRHVDSYLRSQGLDPDQGKGQQPPQPDEPPAGS